MSSSASKSFHNANHSTPTCTYICNVETVTVLGLTMVFNCLCASLYQLLCPFFADWNDYCRQFTITFPQLPQYFIVCHPDDATKYILCNEQGIHIYSGNCIDGKVLKVETIPSLSRTCVDPPQLPKCVNPLITTTQGT